MGVDIEIGLVVGEVEGGVWDVGLGSSDTGWSCRVGVQEGCCQWCQIRLTSESEVALVCFNLAIRHDVTTARYIINACPRNVSVRTVS